MSSQPQMSFRRSAFAATAIAGLAISPLFSAQVHAQTASANAAYQGSAACEKAAKADPTLERAMRCESREMDRRIAAAKQQGIDADRRAADADRRSADADRRSADADRRSAEADRVAECTGFLIAGVKKGLFTKAAVLSVANGKLTPANACTAARGFGFNQKAEMDHPAVQ